jgi:hypothetical protein
VDPAIREHWTEHRNLTSVQVIELVKTHLLDEETHIHFDYYAMVTKCFMVVAKLQDIMQKFLSGSGKQNCLPYELVDEILWNAAQLESWGTGWSRSQGYLYNASVFLDELMSQNKEISSAGLTVARSLSGLRSEQDGDDMAAEG